MTAVAYPERSQRSQCNARGRIRACEGDVLRPDHQHRVCRSSPSLWARTRPV